MKDTRENMSCEGSKQRAFEGGARRTGGAHTFNAALATALSLGLGLAPCAPAAAFADEADVPAGSDAGIEQLLDVSDSADGGGQSAAGAVDAPVNAEGIDGAANAADAVQSASDDAVADSHGSSEAAASDDAGASEHEGSAETGASEDGSAEAGGSDAVSAEPATAEGASGLFAEGGMPLLAEGEADLGALWEGQTGGTDSPLAITAGGTYRLTADLTVNSALEINAPGADVTIDLGSFSLTSEAENATYLIKAASCASLTILGDYDPASHAAQGGFVSADDAQIVMAGASIRHAVESAADRLVVRGVGAYLKAPDDYNDLEKLDAAGFFATRGEVSIDRSAVTIDHGNQTVLNAENSPLEGFPCGIRLAADVSSARIADTAVSVTGSPVVEPHEGSTGLTTSDNAYGLFSESAGEVTVAGGSFKAVSAHGAATAIYGTSLKVIAGANGAAASVEADAGFSATGIRSGALRGATLDGSIEFSLPERYLPSQCAALRSDYENGFVLGGAFSASGATAIVGAFDSANADGARIAAFSADVPAEARPSMAGMVANGLPAGACSVGFDDEGIFFRLDASTAPVCVVSASGAETPYASVGEAVSALRSGETVKLLEDAGDVSISRGSPRNVFTIDLNGHSMRTLSVSSRATVRVVSTSADARGSLTGRSLEWGGAVRFDGSGALEISGVDVTSVSHASEVAAISVSGDGRLSLSDVSVRAVSQTTAATGIRQSAGSGTVEVLGGSVSARTEEPGAAAYGVSSSSANGSVSMSGCAVSARSVDGTTGGIDVRGSLALDGASIEARTERAAATVWAVRASAGTAQVSANACSFSALCDGDASAGAYWCLMAGSAVPSNAAAWTLDGACSFASANGTHIGFSGGPVTIRPGFAPSGRLSVYSADLPDGIAFAPAEGASLSGLAGRVAACEGSPYAGQSLGEAGGGALAWRGRTAARNVTTGAQYASLADALADAGAGQVVQLASDCETTAPLTVAAPVTLDLCGRTLAIALSESSLASSAAALSFRGAGECALEGGDVEVTMRAGSGSVSRDATFSGVSAAAGVRLSVRDATVSVTFESASAGSGATTVVGIDAGSGSVSLENGARVTVDVSGAQAARAVGVSASGGSGSGAAVGRGCAVEASNGAEAQQLGRVPFTSTTGSLDTTRLTRVDLEEGTELYDEIQRKFKERALLDYSGDAEGFVYDTRMYYAAPIALDDGRYVWAFSDPVPTAVALDPSIIVATHFYFPTYYDAVPDACGVSVASSATVSIEGSVSARSDAGNAYALEAGEPSDGEAGLARVAATARLSASGGSDPYRKECGAFDLRCELPIAASSRVVYPITGSYTLVKTVAPQAAAVGGAGASSVAVASGASLSQTGGDGAQTALTEPPDYFPETVRVTFSNLRDSSGALLADEVREQPYGSTLGEGGAPPDPPDYVRDGVTYRFVGWTVSMQSSGSRTWDPEKIEDGLVLDTSSNANAGGVVLAASYAPVAEGEHLAVFEIDGFVEACGVVDGQVPRFTDAQRGSRSEVPTKYVRQSGMRYAFSGWRAEGSDAVYSGNLPPATGDCRYIAAFSETPAVSDKLFYTWQTVGGTLAYAFTEVEAATGEPLDDYAAELAKPGDAVYGESEVYEFEGWSPRRSDARPLYADGLPDQVTATYVGSSVGTATSWFGIYSARERRVDVSFMVDGELYAEADDIATSTTVNGAFEKSGAAKPADKSETERFRGWALGSADGALLMGAVKTLSGLTEGENDIVLYAVFGSGQTADEMSGDDEGGGSGAAPIPAPNVSGGSGSSGGGGIKAAFGSAVAVANPAAAAIAESKELKDREGADGSQDAPAPADTAGDQPSNDASGDSVWGGADWLSSTQEGSRLGNTVSFFGVVAAAVAVCAGALWRAWRNRRLDVEDDYYEPDANADQGEQVTF